MTGRGCEVRSFVLGERVWVMDPQVGMDLLGIVRDILELLILLGCLDFMLLFVVDYLK